jgi:hypothetical protein
MYFQPDRSCWQKNANSVDQLEVGDQRQTPSKQPIIDCRTIPSPSSFLTQNIRSVRRSTPSSALSFFLIEDRPHTQLTSRLYTSVPPSFAVNLLQLCYTLLRTIPWWLDKRITAHKRNQQRKRRSKDTIPSSRKTSLNSVHHTIATHT